IKTALQCGRRLQYQIERRERRDHIRGVRGRAVHSAVEAWEKSQRTGTLPDLVAEAWWDILAEAEVDPAPVMKPVLALWEAEAEIADRERHVLEHLHGQYKNPRASKEYKEGVAHLDPYREQVAEQRAKIEGLIADASMPWLTDRGILAEGMDHSLETTRRGTAYLAELWPDPDIMGAEWNLEADLGNGYRVHGFIDRVEASDGIAVVDYKSSKYQDSPLDHFLQVAVYATVAEAHMGFAPDEVALVYLRDQAVDRFPVDPAWPDRLRMLVEAADRVLATESFAPTFAGCGICSYFHHCEAEFPLVPVEIEGAA
ncbi:MAG: PD-(D/E)XK nuclease family protein, partial [Actinomycetota bacterium]